MRQPVTSVGVAVTTLLVTASPLLGQSSALAGTWTMNLAKSTYSPGPAPKSQVITWERVAGGFKCSTDSVDAAGKATHADTLEKDDGSDAPVQGAQTPTTRFLRRLDDRTYEDGDVVNGKVTVARTLVIAPDGRTLTVTAKGTNVKGEAVNNVVVYEKRSRHRRSHRRAA
jgi:hypothetical protein